MRNGKHSEDPLCGSLATIVNQQLNGEASAIESVTASSALFLLYIACNGGVLARRSSSGPRYVSGGVVLL